VCRRQSFTYFNDLAVIAGNDMVEGNVVAMTQYAEYGNLFVEAIDLGDDEEINTPLNVADDLDEDYLQSNQSTTSIRNNPSTPMTRRPKRRKTSMTSSLDVVSERLNKNIILLYY
jgi:fatty acid/phospholipid biosynthesis enzyme